MKSHLALARDRRQSGRHGSSRRWLLPLLRPEKEAAAATRSPPGGCFLLTPQAMVIEPDVGLAIRLPRDSEQLMSPTCPGGGGGGCSRVGTGWPGRWLQETSHCKIGSAKALLKNRGRPGAVSDATSRIECLAKLLISGY